MHTVPGKWEMRGVLGSVSWNEYKAMHRSTIRGRASALLNKARTRSKARKLACTITREWVIEQLQKPCPITGRVFDLSRGDGRRKPNSPSLDRINPKRGYVPGNVRVVTSQANLALNEFGDAALASFVEDVMRQLAAKTRKGKVQRSSRKGVGASAPKCVRTQH